MIGQSISAAFFHSRKAGIPLFETFGEGVNCRSDGKFPPIPYAVL